MANETAISWTNLTWNPMHGCSKISEGCRHCYAETLSLRYGHTEKPWTFRNAKENVTLKRHKLRDPLSWKSPKRIFVNSMSDMFHEEVPDDYIRECFEVMRQADWHVYQILTKRAERMAELAPSLPWGEHIWMGVSVESERVLPRIDMLRSVPTPIRFISFEPLIGPIDRPDLSGIQWAIVGGESGAHLKEEPHRWMDHAWARGIRDACLDQNVAFFFKQSSGYRTELNVALEHEDGTFWLWQQFPDHMRAPIQVPRQINGSELGLYLTKDYSKQKEMEPGVHQLALL